MQRECLLFATPLPARRKYFNDRGGPPHRRFVLKTWRNDARASTCRSIIDLCNWTAERCHVDLFANGNEERSLWRAPFDRVRYFPSSRKEQRLCKMDKSGDSCYYYKLIEILIFGFFWRLKKNIWSTFLTSLSERNSWTNHRDNVSVLSKDKYLLVYFSHQLNIKFNDRDRWK